MQLLGGAEQQRLPQGNVHRRCLCWDVKDVRGKRWTPAGASRPSPVRGELDAYTMPAGSCTSSMPDAMDLT